MAGLSVLVIGLTYLVCDFLRRQCQLRMSPGFTKNTILDFMVSLELCIGSFELGVILDHYGILAWSLGLVTTVIYQVLRWKDVEGPSPGVHFQGYFEGNKSLQDFIVRSAILLVSGLLAYRFISILWSYELSVMHSGRPDATGTMVCTVPWGSIPTHISFLAEFLGTLVLGVGIKLILDNKTLANNDPIYTAGIIAAFVLATVLAAFDISGGMFNPMLATALLGGCKGHSHLQHIVVYWVGGFSGTFATSKVYPTIKKMVYSNAVEDQRDRKVKGDKKKVN